MATTFTIEALPSTGSPLVIQAEPAGLGKYYLNRNGLKDWESGSDSKSEVRERPQADGAFDISHDFYESLVFSAEGWYSGVNRADAKAAKAYLRKAVVRGRPVRATLDDVDGRWGRVASVRKLTIPDSGNSPVFKFSIDMVAPDPLMYGDEIALPAVGVPASGGGLHLPFGTRRSDDTVDTTTAYWDFGADGSSGRVLVTNTGSADSFPDFDVTGGLGDGVIVTDVTAARSVRLDRVIPVGSTVTVKQRTGRAYIDGPNDISGDLTVDDFFAVGPGETHIIQFSPVGTVTGTPQLFVRFRPAQ